MIAASEISIRDGNRSGVAAPTTPIFSAAHQELCARIWIELELLARTAERAASAPAPDVAMRAQILRLELVVLVDACRSVRWRCLLPVEHCERLCALLTDVLAALYVESEHLLIGIAEAQNLVLDELTSSVSASSTAPLHSRCLKGGRTAQGAAK